MDGPLNFCDTLFFFRETDKANQVCALPFLGEKITPYYNVNIQNIILTLFQSTSEKNLESV